MDIALYISINKDSYKCLYIDIYINRNLDIYMDIYINRCTDVYINGEKGRDQDIDVIMNMEKYIYIIINIGFELNINKDIYG